MIWVVQAEYKEDYKIYVKFNNGEEGVINLMSSIFNDTRPVFQELRDVNIFKKFLVDMDTITWPNGADFAPEFLHDMLKKNLKVSS